MINLGKILFISLFSTQLLFAAIEARVDRTVVEEGDIVTLILEISGARASKPNIDTICEAKIINQTTHSSYVINNGKYQNNYMLSYQFMPKKSCTIEAIEMEIEGKIVSTKPIEITVKPIVYTKDSPYILELKTNKKELYIGEEFEVDLYFKQKRTAEAIDSSFTPPIFQGFWIKKEHPSERYDSEDYFITKIKYIVAAQRDGNNTINPAKMNIKTRKFKRDSFGYSTQNIQQKIYSSNKLDFTIKPLPSGVRLIGDFTLEATANKTVVEANEPLELTIKLNGKGNFEDVGSLRPYISGVSIFEEKEQINENLWSQKITFVADNNFTISPIELKYFNPTTKEIIKLKTQAIDIEVKNANLAPKLEVYKADTESIKEIKVEYKTNPLYFLLGLVIGVVLGFLISRIKPWQKKTQEVSIKEPKVLLMKLVPYKEDKDVKNTIENLERHIYYNEVLNIDKKLLKEIVKKYNLS